MRVALDAMGGDNAPREIIRGALLAARSERVEIILVGDPAEIEKVGKEEGLPYPGIQVVPASQRVEMDEQPSTVVRQKKDSSLGVAARLVKEGKAEALVSAGNTGAAMAFALFTWGRLPGIERPAIAVPFPTLVGVTVLLDVGANVEVKPRYLLQYAQMGSVYAENVLGIKKPRVGLLNVGTEKTKGTAISQEAYELLESSGLNFSGNLEGRDIPLGTADVVVCDGFCGNVVLKFTEGLAEGFFTLLRRELARNWRTKLGAYLVKPALRGLKKRMDYSEYGGAPLLGLKGTAIISHGASDAKAIANAIRVARESWEQDVTGKIALLGEKKSRAGSEE
ncbi:MAG: phosphate acyltransferase PlsX [Firmicutes bacterium]|nr:phosphate acyltransferase PlsX [Bacillota bacterium]